MKTIIKNDNLGYYLNELFSNDYKYIIKAKDKMLSGWGNATGKTHIQLIACKRHDELNTILDDLRNDNTFNYINFYVLPYEFDKLINLSYKYSYTIRNDWTRFLIRKGDL